MSIDARITDNGPEGPVTVVKGGPGFIKFRGNNTYSGGTYFLQGRIQVAGSEVGTGTNPDAFGSGPIFVFPGCYLYLNPVSMSPVLTNELYIAGDGTQQERLGAIRFQNAGWSLPGVINLIGDATIGGNNGTVVGRITGPFNMTFGSAGTVQGTLVLSGTSNDWTGDTTLQSRFFNGNGNNTLLNGASEVIPHGFGKGNVTVFSTAGNAHTWNLNGNSETINGLSTSPAATSTILNNSGGGA
jgi:autotransporter-associated beta strand protein